MNNFFKINDKVKAVIPFNMVSCVSMMNNKIVIEYGGGGQCEFLGDGYLFDEIVAPFIKWLESQDNEELNAKALQEVIIASKKQQELVGRQLDASDKHSSTFEGEKNNGLVSITITDEIKRLPNDAVVNIEDASLMFNSRAMRAYVYVNEEDWCYAFGSSAQEALLSCLRGREKLKGKKDEH